MKKTMIFPILVFGLTVLIGCSKQNPVSPVSQSSTAPSAPTFVTWSTLVVNPMGIAADSMGNLYVADSGENQILKFNSHGNLLAHWGKSGIHDNSLFFNQIFSLAVDSSSNLYVADAGMDKVMKYSVDGVLLGQWGQAGSGAGQLRYPFGVAVDRSGTIYLADSFNARIQKLALGQSAFTQVTPVGLLQEPVGLTLDGQGNIITTDYNANVLVKYNETTGASTTIGGPGSGQGQFLNPTSVLLDGSGNILVVDYNNNRVQMLDPQGSYLKEWGTSGPSDWRLKYPVGAVISEGFLYVTDSGNHRIVKYSL